MSNACEFVRRVRAMLSRLDAGVHYFAVGEYPDGAYAVLVRGPDGHFVTLTYADNDNG